MSETTIHNQSSTEDSQTDICVVCFKNVEIYSVGECDHPVCYECSTRMRVLCQQNECPICRKSLSKVIFTNQKFKYRELEASNRSEHYNKKYKIAFENSKIQNSFYSLLDHPCAMCKCPPFHSFEALKDHVRREHEHYYCDICTEHLKIFSFERKCYNRHDLALHRRKGDVDNTSHRGHPLCQYCDYRFLDRDELFRHLRKEHYFCHFCDADGSNEFYADYESLREHFRNEHYLCEEGDCIREQFTAVFRSDIDLKAHFANVHGKLLNKQQAKHARTLQLEIRLGHRGRSSNAKQDNHNGANIHMRRTDHYDDVSDSQQHQESARSTPIAPLNEQEFPSLRGVASNASTNLIGPNMANIRKSGPGGLARTKENFPALGPPCTETAITHKTTNNNGFAASVIIKGSSKSSQNKTAQNNMVIQENFPALGPPCAETAMTHKTNNNNGTAASVIIKGSSKPSQNKTAQNNMVIQENFPALGPPSSETANKTNNNNGTAARVIMKGNLKSQNKTGQNGMVIHVSNRPSTSNSKSLSSKKDFPALSGHSKHQYKSDDEDDMFSASEFHNLNGMAAKHRTLVDNYVSVINPTSNSKIQTIVENNDKVKKQTENKEMKLTNNDFPALSLKPTNTVQQTNWVRSQKQKEQENRKTKVAPAPVLPKKIENAKKSDDYNDSNNNKKKVNKNIEQKKSNELNKKKLPENIKKLNNIEVQTSSRNTKKPSSDAKMVNGVQICNDEYETQKIIKPPPGFNSITLSSVAKPATSLTFTNSLGECYNMLPDNIYLPPPNADSRNKELPFHFQKALQTPEEFNAFRETSCLFRQSKYDAASYFDECKTALKDKFDEIFPELLALLPDISKQQDLYLEYQQYLKKSSKKLKADQKLDMCSTCKQILKSYDFDSHVNSHQLNSNFPKL